MADLADLADKQNEMNLKVAVQNGVKPSGPVPCGVCYNCGAPMQGSNRWCDAECREDWELNKKRVGK